MNNFHIFLGATVADAAARPLHWVYDPKKLIGRKVVFVANLAARKMRFGVSEGMVLAASGTAADNGIFLIGPDVNAEPGMRVR